MPINVIDRDDYSPELAAVIDRVDLLTRARIAELGRLAAAFVKNNDGWVASSYARRAAHEARQTWPELFVWVDGERYGQQLSIREVA